MKINEFETKRCLLREITLEDAIQIVEWRSNPNVYKFFKNPIKIDVDSHLRWFNESYVKNDSRIDMIAFIKNTKLKIGVFGVNRIDSGTAEVSYLLDPQYQGKGYAFEILSAIEDYFFKIWDIKMFIAEIHKHNINSISFIERRDYTKLKEEGNFIIYGKRL